MKKIAWPRAYRGRQIDDRCEPGLVSVIIPTYNRADLLPEAMDSIWAQTYRPIELIVVDDGSTDDTREVVAGWGRRCAGDDRFALRYLYQENRGLSASRNAGALESRGAYLQFLDSDDYLHPDRFRRVLEAVESVDGCEIVVTGFALVDERRRPYERREPVDLTAPNPLVQCVCRPLWAASPVYARDFFKKVGFFRPEVPYGEDWEYGLRVGISCRPERCALVAEPLVYYRIHGGPRIMSAKRTRRDIEQLFAAAQADLAAAGVRTRYFNMLGGGLVLWFAEHNDVAYLRRALRLPCSPGLKGKIAILLLLGALLDGPSVVRFWYRLRGLSLDATFDAAAGLSAVSAPGRRSGPRAGR